MAFSEYMNFNNTRYLTLSFSLIGAIFTITIFPLYPISVHERSTEISLKPWSTLIIAFLELRNPSSMGEVISMSESLCPLALNPST